MSIRRRSTGSAVPVGLPQLKRRHLLLSGELVTHMRFQSNVMSLCGRRAILALAGSLWRAEEAQMRRRPYLRFLRVDFVGEFRPRMYRFKLIARAFQSAGAYACGPQYVSIDSRPRL